MIGAVATNGDHARQARIARPFEVLRNLFRVLRDGDYQAPKFFPQERFNLRPEFPRASAACVWIQYNECGHGYKFSLSITYAVICTSPIQPILKTVFLPIEQSMTANQMLPFPKVCPDRY